LTFVVGLFFRKSSSHCRMFLRSNPWRWCSILLCAVASYGCADTTSFGDPVQGAPITVTQAVQPATMGKTVVIEGTLHEICRDEGCWFILSDGTSEITVRYIGDNGLGIPIIAQGRARVLGRLKDTVIGRNRVPELRARGVQLLAQ
jgi:uncharacterized protein YdeI (BOF family)